MTRTGWRQSAGLATVAVFIFAGAQLARPELNTPPVTADLQAPVEVKQILRNSCYNCHSNETKLAWFDQIVPAYWLVTRDVNEARKHLNFSEIGLKPAAMQKAALYEAVNQIQLGAMPLPAYRRMHPEAAVTSGQLAVLRAYLHAPPTSNQETAAADSQYEQWIAAGTAARQVRAAPNGIEFLPEYKNWKIVSATERFDNGSTRVILGNDVATKAIAENHINPWPDGTTFAKVAWAAVADGNGQQRAGSFQQVEFMIKDRAKYASTKGWGFARWRGAELKPYGASADFTGECVGCHTPVAKNDYVFTMPIATGARSSR